MRNRSRGCDTQNLVRATLCVKTHNILQVLETRLATILAHLCSEIHLVTPYLGRHALTKTQVRTTPIRAAMGERKTTLASGLKGAPGEPRWGHKPATLQPYNLQATLACSSAPSGQQPSNLQQPLGWAEWVEPREIAAHCSTDSVARRVGLFYLSRVIGYELRVTNPLP